jgi:predicted TIM-barrel fold metal-dependent hydrolase
LRIVAIEEHFGKPDLVGRIDRASIGARGWPRPEQLPPIYQAYARGLGDVGNGRLAAMDDAGVAFQVLSAAGPGADLLEGADGIALAADYNTALRQIMRQHPTRFGGFAHLPMASPDAAADELERAVTELGFCGAMVNGMSNGLFLDDMSFEPLLDRAEKLDRPLYLHPAPPPEAVRKAYYDGLPGYSGPLLALGGWGWHYETALHVVRLVLSGALDRHPELKLIVGHMGEGLPVMLARLDDVMGASTSGYLQRSVSETILDQVWITTSGFTSLPPFMAALMTFGADRIIFSTDYPFSPIPSQVDFLKSLPVSPEDRAKIACKNAEKLLKIDTRARSTVGGSI